MTSTFALPSALDQLDEIFRHIARQHLALFLDYDGTLTPIVARPELARLAESIRETLRQLARRCPVAIVSGRGLDDVRRLVGLDELTYAGSHGFEIEGPAGSGIQHREGQDVAPQVEAAQAELDDALAPIEGVLLERKAFSLAVHYRLVAPDAVEQLERTVAEVLARHPRLREGRGKCVIELQPALDWHKGKAVRWLLEQNEQRNGPSVALYLGDDLTDEHAFDALPAPGVGIVVAREDRETAARYRLRDTNDVQTFLEALAAHLVYGESAVPHRQE